MDPRLTNPADRKPGDAPQVRPVNAFLGAPQRPDEIGRLGPYRILGELGRGGMGVVFRAEETDLRRQVALKVMLPGAAADPRAVARFRREAEAQAKVEHDHIIAIYRVGVGNGVPFIAMPLLKGQTLAQALQLNPRPPLAEVVRIGWEVAEGLAAAHAVGLIHRDIKPANVWLEGSKRRVKILDFGLARGVAADADEPATFGSVPAVLGPQLTAAGAVMGTPAYMSPEQALGRPVDHRCDLFSLGAVLYQMAAGQLPFTGSSAFDVLAAVASHEPPPVHTVAPDVPPALSELIWRLLAKNPADRPQSADAVAEELQAAERGLAVLPVVVPLGNVPGEPTPWETITDTEVVAVTPDRPPTPRPVQGRKPLLLVAGVVLLACAAVAGVMMATRGGKPPEPEPVAPPVAAPPADPTKPLGTYTGLPAPAVGAGYIDDGRNFVALAEDGWVFEWNNDTPGPARRRWRAHPVRGYGLAVCPDGRVITGGNDDAGNSAVVGWNAETRRPEWTIRAGVTWTNVISVNRDGSRAVATGRGGTGIVFDPRTGAESPGFRCDRWLNAVAISPDGTRAVSGSQWEQSAQVWDVANAVPLGKPGPLPSGASTAAAFSPDGRTIAVGGMDGLVRLWNADTGENGPTLHGHRGAVMAVAFSPDGTRLVTGGTDATVRIWDAKTGGELAVYRGHKEPVWAVCFAPHGRQILSAGRDRNVFTWANR